MINLEEIRFNEPIYYIPSYSQTPQKVQICRIKDDLAFVKPYSRKQDFTVFPIPAKFICNSPKETKMCGRAWEKWKRTQK